MGGENGGSRRTLARHLWPDKLLYASTLLLVVGITGLLFGTATTVFDVAYAERVPDWVAAYPPWLTALASAATTLVAYLSLARRDALIGILAAVLGIAAFGFLGMGSVLSLVALGFLVQSVREDENTPATRTLAADLWPDKTLAAGVILLVAGAVNLVWGFAMMTHMATLPSYGVEPGAMGFLTIIVGLVGIGAGLLNHRQRAPALGALASFAGGATVAGFFVTPLLGAAALALIGLGIREREYVRRRTPDPEPA